MYRVLWVSFLAVVGVCVLWVLLLALVLLRHSIRKFLRRRDQRRSEEVIRVATPKPPEEPEHWRRKE